MTAVEAPTTVWDRLLAPPDGEISPDHARYLLRLGFTPADHQRMTELCAKNTAGELSPGERAELNDYVLVGLQLTRLHSLARMALRRADGGG